MTFSRPPDLGASRNTPGSERGKEQPGGLGALRRGDGSGLVQAGHEKRQQKSEKPGAFRSMIVLRTTLLPLGALVARRS